MNGWVGESSATPEAFGPQNWGHAAAAGAACCASGARSNGASAGTIAMSARSGFMFLS